MIMHALVKIFLAALVATLSSTLSLSYAQTATALPAFTAYTFADSINGFSRVYVAQKSENIYTYTNPYFTEQTFSMRCEAAFGEEYCFIVWNTISFTVQTPYKLDVLLPGKNMPGYVTVSRIGQPERVVYVVDVTVAEEYGEKVVRISDQRTGRPIIVTAISPEFPFVHPLWQHVRFTTNGLIPFISYSLDQRTLE